MKANEIRFQDLLIDRTQYVIPLFQRPYRWGPDQWLQLWDDLMHLYTNQNLGNHFVGSIVTQPISTEAGGVTKFSVIDGQQRITTLLVLLSVIRQKTIQYPDSQESLGEQILETCLINKFASDETSKVKLLPGRLDRKPFNSLIEDDIEPMLDTRIGQAQHFFERMIQERDSQQNVIDLRLLKDCITDRLEVVSITLQADDNPYKIFESINFTGMAPTASDIIRNFIFMNIRDLDEQSQVYENHWHPIENILRGDIDRFFWRYLHMEGIRKSNQPRPVFMGIKDLLGNSNHTTVNMMAQRFHRFSRFWAQLKGVDRTGLNSSTLRQIDRLNRVTSDVVYPFLMRTLHQLNIGKVSENELVEVMKMLESSIVRKAICGDTRRMDNLNQLTREVDFEEFVQSTKSVLTGSNWNWPNDELFFDEFIQAEQYSSQPATQTRTRLILETLEESFGHRETPAMAEGVQIEHIMPQTLSDEWKTSIGENWPEDHEHWLHTIGNLTLTAYNPELSNKSFSEKRDILSNSNFAMNASLQDYDEWNVEAIEQRGRELAERALKIWPR